MFFPAFRSPRTVHLTICALVGDSRSESDGAWHGGCLALAELARRGAVCPSVFVCVSDSVSFVNIFGFLCVSTVRGLLGLCGFAVCYKLAWRSI